MPLPRALARFNLKVTNPILGHAAARLPGFAIVTHVGRRSRKRRTTPVNLFRDGDTYVFALTYGPDSQWVKNVAHRRRMRHPHAGTGRPSRRAAPRTRPGPYPRPAPVRAILGAVRVEHFLVLRRDNRTN